mmetsp:Transcript_23738/g.57253  ORF Transcript_23738/g.57253 Transcript_23738/m.57253 type:complete len:241 (-) Transcript_23738:207-929(-)
MPGTLDFYAGMFMLTVIFLLQYSVRSQVCRYIVKFSSTACYPGIFKHAVQSLSIIFSGQWHQSRSIIASANVLASNKNTRHARPFRQPTELRSNFVSLITWKQVEFYRLVRYRLLFQIILRLPAERARRKAVHGHGRPPDEFSNGPSPLLPIVLSRDEVGHGLFEFVPDVVRRDHIGKLIREGVLLGPFHRFAHPAALVLDGRVGDTIVLELEYERGELVEDRTFHLVETNVGADVPPDV